VATDSHNLKKILSDRKLIEKKISDISGIENTERIMYENPQRVLENKDVLAMSEVRKRLFVTNIFRKLSQKM